MSPTRENGNTARGNGPYDTESNGAPLRRSAIRALVQDFSPLWFTWAMNSGILAILLHELPYQFNGLPVIATVFFIFDLVVFLAFSAIMLLRFAWFRRSAYLEIVNNTNELALLGCWAIAYITIPPLIALIPSNARWGGYDWTLLAYVLWWIGGAWIVAALCFVFIVMIQRKQGPDQVLPTSVIIPAVGVSTLAVTGALITIHGVGMNPRLAVPVIIVGFLATGAGLVLGLILSTYLFHQILTKGWPPPEQTASLYIFIGPMGQCAAALQLLGSSASEYRNFAGYNKGTFLTQESAQSLSTACILVALLLTGMGFIWIIFATFAMLERAYQRKLKWTPGFNSLIFPTATVVTSCSQFAIEMDSPAWRVLTTIFVVALVVIFVLNLFMTVFKVAKGDVLIVREDPRVRHRMEEQHKEK